MKIENKILLFIVLIGIGVFVLMLPLLMSAAIGGIFGFDTSLNIDTGSSFLRFLFVGIFKVVAWILYGPILYGPVASLLELSPEPVLIPFLLFILFYYWFFLSRIIYFVFKKTKGLIILLMKE